LHIIAISVFLEKSCVWWYSLTHLFYKYIIESLRPTRFKKKKKY